MADDTRNALEDAVKGLLQETTDIVEFLRAGEARKLLDRIGELPDPNFLDIAKVAAAVCGTPIGAVGIIDDDTAFYKGLFYDQDVPSAPRENVICNLVLADPLNPLIIPDTKADPRTTHLPFVNGTYDHCRFYAGLPLTTEAGNAVGSLCVLDRNPRQLSDHQLLALKSLRRLVMTLLELQATRP